MSAHSSDPPISPRKIPTSSIAAARSTPCHATTVVSRPGGSPNTRSTERSRRRARTLNAMVATRMTVPSVAASTMPRRGSVRTRCRFTMREGVESEMTSWARSLSSSATANPGSSPRSSASTMLRLHCCHPRRRPRPASRRHSRPCRPRPRPVAGHTDDPEIEVGRPLTEVERAVGHRDPYGVAHAEPEIPQEPAGDGDLIG